MLKCQKSILQESRLHLLLCPFLLLFILLPPLPLHASLSDHNDDGEIETRHSYQGGQPLHTSLNAPTTSNTAPTPHLGMHPVPGRPYDRHNVPQTLQVDPRFTYLKTWGYRYFVAAHSIGAFRYVVGLGAAGCLTASKWDYFDAQTQGNFDIAAIVLTYSYGVLEGITQYCSAKTQAYEKESQGYLDQANLDAGRPITQDTTDQISLGDV